MKIKSTLILLLAFILNANVTAQAEEPTKKVDTYPLSTCVVSGEKLKDGAMGPVVNYMYKQEGKPDRLVRFCCKGCIKDFKKDPDKYLKKIDDAAAAKGKEHAVSEMEGHTGHGSHH